MERAFGFMIERKWHLLQRMYRVLAAHAGAAVEQLRAAKTCEVRLEIKECTLAHTCTHLPREVDVSPATSREAVTPCAVVDGPAPSVTCFL